MTSLGRRLARADRSGTIDALPPPAAEYVHVRASRDGSRLAVDTDNGTTANIWVYEMSGSSAIRQLTFAGKNRFPVWSQDGQRIAFQSDREGDQGIFAQRADGTGAVERLTKPETGEAHIPEAWSPDGRHLSFSVLKNSKYTLSTLSVPDRTIEPFGKVESFEPPGSVFSPDGRWLAYHVAPERRVAGSDGGIFVQPFPATGEIHQAPKVDRDFQPVWSRDGAELMYVPLAASGRLAAVKVSTKPSVMFGSPQDIPTEVIAGRTSALTRAFDVLPDGRLVGPVSLDASGATLQGEIRVVLNWFEELKARVPATR
jgi:Tol biopolymer transport system component